MRYILTESGDSPLCNRTKVDAFKTVFFSVIAFEQDVRCLCFSECMSPSSVSQWGEGVRAKQGQADTFIAGINIIKQHDAYITVGQIMGLEQSTGIL
jgi:hypothetical protein